MGAFKLGKMTFGSLFKKPETVLYPIEAKPQPVGLKGHIELDIPACILCGMCERSCATNCIEVDKQRGTWGINRMQCVQCGYCVTVCPKKCLSMDPNYAPAMTSKHLSIYMVKHDDGARAKGPEPAPAEIPVPQADEPAAIHADAAGDRQLETLLSLMDPAKAEKVRGLVI